MGRWDMSWDTLLVIYVPLLLGLTAFTLIALIVWSGPSRWVCVPAGVLGFTLLLWALWAYVSHPVFAPWPKECRSVDRTEKFFYLPQAISASFVPSPSSDSSCILEPFGPEPEEPAGPARSYPCLYCGCLAFPVPKGGAITYVCPVCFWENDVFDPDEDAPSDKNRGITLQQGRENYQKWGAVRGDFVRHARPPRPGGQSL